MLRVALKKHELWANIADEVRMLKENKDIGRELAASAPRSLYPAVILSMHTGLRNEELRHLRRRQIDLRHDHCAKKGS